jgi:hypothetical protein
MINPFLTISIMKYLEAVFSNHNPRNCHDDSQI